MNGELLEKIRRFNGDRDWERFHTPKNLSVSVMIEAGELAEVFQWLTPSESAQPDRETVERAGEEIADVLIYLLNLADKLGIDPVRAAEEKLSKNALKYPAEVCRGSSLKYTRRK